MATRLRRVCALFNHCTRVCKKRCESSTIKWFSDSFLCWVKRAIIIISTLEVFIIQYYDIDVSVNSEMQKGNKFSLCTVIYYWFHIWDPLLPHKYWITVNPICRINKWHYKEEIFCEFSNKKTAKKILSKIAITFIIVKGYWFPWYNKRILYGILFFVKKTHMDSHLRASRNRRA